MKTALRILMVATLMPTLLYGAPTVEGAQVGSQAASNLFQEAMHLEEVVGDLPAAIRLYRRIVDEFPTQQSLAAAALVRMGQCYEKLGDAQAREAYERVVSDYPGELAAATEARSRLAFLQSGDEAGRGPGIVTRQVWPDADYSGELATVSPDGRYVAFVDWGRGWYGAQDLEVYDTETGRTRPLTNWVEAEDHLYVEYHAWSGDGARIAYTRWNGADPARKELRVLRVDGADDHILFVADESPDVKPMAWSRAGDFIVCIFGPYGGPGVPRIGTISTEDGAVQILKTLGNHGPVALSLSPDDRYIVYDYPQGDDVPRRDDRAVHDVFILATDGSGEERLVSHAADDESPLWTPDGRRVVFLSDRSGRRSLYAVEVRDGRPAGDPELVRPGVGDMLTMGFSRAGALYYALAAGSTDVYLAELDLGGGVATLGEPSPLTDRWEGTNSLPSWSPDGLRIAFYSRRGPGEGNYVVVKSMDTGEEHDFAVPFTDRQIRGTWGGAEWSADGRHLLFDNRRLDLETGDWEPEEFGVRDYASRSGSARLLATAVQEEALRAAGIRILPRGRAPYPPSFELGRVPLRPGEELMWLSEGVNKMLPGGEVEEIGPRGYTNSWALSPDGTQLAWAVSVCGGNREMDCQPSPTSTRPADSIESSNRLLIMPVKGGEIRELARLPGVGDQRSEIGALQWTPDGQGLLYRVGGWSRGVWHVPTAGGVPQRLDLDRLDFRFHPDGKRVAFWTRDRRTEIWLMEGFSWQH